MEHERQRVGPPGSREAEEALPRYKWTLLRAGSFRLDGGAMFGLIPRTVWSRMVEQDERGRISVQHNCLLLERAEDGPGPKLLLIESGTGNKLDAKSRDIFDLEDRCIIDAVRDIGVQPEDIGGVVVSHLHFDHAGGLTRLCGEYEAPDWRGQASTMAGARGEHGVKLTFPNARVYVQAREWADALENKSVMTRTYFADHLEPLRNRIVLIDSARPFAPGIVPGREQDPAAPVELRRSEIVPGSGVWVFLTPGHTWGQQAVQFVDTTGQTVVFTPDVMPTVNHCGQPYSLAYDVEPYTSMVTRRWFLESAAQGKWLLVLDHEPGNPCQTVRRNEKGWFDLVPWVGPS